MLRNAVKLIMSELRSYIASIDEVAADGPDFVVMGNIALFDNADQNASIKDRVVASVINVAEESSVKNAPHFERNGNQTRYRNAPAFINVYLLFSANYANYETALKRLSNILTFFQGKNVFTVKDSPNEAIQTEETSELRLIMELFALTFEQVNYVWASLGGKQMPFVLYKVRMVRVQADATYAEGRLIEEIAARDGL